ncbi:hypothetical protein AAC03nite_03010 [Alicyclobacillus acidoterrestris]|nr:hypothetical protein AAC03nite_03010 [Alicyclobacillus acidoterrestris]
MTTYQLRQDSGGPGQNEVEQALFAAMKYGAMQLGFTFGLSALSRRLGVSSAGRRGALSLA